MRFIDVFHQQIFPLSMTGSTNMRFWNAFPSSHTSEKEFWTKIQFPTPTNGLGFSPYKLIRNSLPCGTTTIPLSQTLGLRTPAPLCLVIWSKYLSCLSWGPMWRWIIIRPEKIIKKYSESSPKLNCICI